MAAARTPTKKPTAKIAQVSWREPRPAPIVLVSGPEEVCAERAIAGVRDYLRTEDPALDVIEDLKSTPAVVRFSTRFVIVADYTELVAHDIKTNETIGFPIREIDQHFAFFLPGAGMEKAQYVAESHADVKAAERMGKLFDELLHANPGIFDDERGRHSLNIFFTRLLFCFFAEDTGIFGDNQFTNTIGSQTQSDGSDLAEFLTDLFKALDTENAADKPKHLSGFPHLNGRLFTVKDDQVVPRFTKQARDELIASGTLIWRDINPDIFGSMFQAIVTPGKRSDLGQHYTSVPNILKTWVLRKRSETLSTRARSRSTRSFTASRPRASATTSSTVSPTSRRSWFPVLPTRSTTCATTSTRLSGMSNAPHD